MQTSEYCTNLSMYDVQDSGLIFKSMSNLFDVHVVENVSYVQRKYLKNTTYIKQEIFVLKVTTIILINGIQKLFVTE